MNRLHPEKLTLETHLNYVHCLPEGVYRVESVVFLHAQLPGQLPSAALRTGSPACWSFVAARALDVVLPPNNDVPHFGSFCGTDFSGTPGLHKTLSSKRIRQEVYLRFCPDAGKFGAAHDLQDQAELAAHGLRVVWQTEALPYSC